MSPPKKAILIKTTANSKIGMGHLYRCLALAKALETERTVFFQVNNSPQVTELVRQQRLKNLNNSSAASIIEDQKIDLLIFDHIGGDKGLFDGLKQHFPSLKIVALDYFNYENKSVDAIINLFDHHPEKPKPGKNGARYYEGLEYAVVRQDFQHYIPRVKDIRKKVKNVLVTFGGVDAGNNTGMTLSLLKTMAFNDVRIDVILGPLWNGDSLPQAPNIRVHRFIPSSQMARFMATADIAFCGAGTTMMELLAIGTPAIVLPQNQMEEKFALNAEEKGAIKLIKGEVQAEDIAYVRELLISSTERRRLSNNGRQLIDGKGEERIIRIIRQMLTGGGT